ncbi:zinc protease [Sulfuritortus calidifontis]|uniref:Zinc protease n=1 Tax=Sulfuritortus calidifontis TaxID=1914471 RepID=A0A4R3JYC1_9PROT|nr:pitrilysin family protein [Sulfuritortus calidifontis]TCS73474.1 zinc protease [Sulfuritortus calidifontis]
MRLFRWLLPLLLAALPPLAQAGIAERTLANGMRVIVKTDARAPVVVSQVWYHAGSMDEGYGETGVAHVLEHMMFKGTPTVPAGEFSRLIAAAGGRENAFTARDHTAYFQTLQKDRLELALKLEADRMVNLTLAPEEFAKEIQVVMEERRMRTEDEPRSRLYEDFMATALKAHPYRHPVIGWMNDLKHMTVADARSWYQRWYAPNNATLVVAGDVEPETVFALAEKYFGPIPARALPERKTQAEPEQAGMRRVVTRAPAKLPYLIMAWPAPKLADPAQDWEPYALQVLAGVLDGNASARLPQRLVRERKLATDVGAGYDESARGPVQFMLDATPAEGHSVDAVVAALKAELARVQREGVDQQELQRVKAQVLASQVFQRDSLFYQAMQIGQWVTAGLDYRLLDQRYEKIRAVTAEQVREVARRYLSDDKLTLAVLDPLPLPAGQAEKPASMGARHVR